MTPPSPDGIRIHTWQAFFFVWVMLLSLTPLPAFAKTVFLICDGQFETSMVMNGPVETEQFDGSLYLLTKADDFAVCQVKLLPFERSKRLAAIKLTPRSRSNDDGRVTQLPQPRTSWSLSKLNRMGRLSMRWLVMTRRR